VRTHIDWLTFTFTPEYTDETEEGYANALNDGISRLIGISLATQIFAGLWQTKIRSRPPYTDAWCLASRGLSLFASPNLTHACCEISGEGCETLISQGLLNELLTKVRERVTRIDIATDIETEEMPLSFVSQTSHERMRSSGYQQSETGQTCYVGSKKSDRYARVYRYYPPHPRSKLLRIEHVFRRDYSRVVAAAIVENGIISVAAQAGKAFGWASGTWDLHEERTVDISATKPERNGGTTIGWLVRSVAPAFRRLCADGTIKDPEQFYREYFAPRESMLD